MNIELSTPEYSMRGTIDKMVDAFFMKINNFPPQGDARVPYSKAMFAAWMAARDESKSEQIHG